MIAVFDSIAVALMLLAYALEARSRWFVALYAAVAALAAAYSGVVEAVWALVALRRCAVRRGSEMRPDTP